jgi:hypothetical protein
MKLVPLKGSSIRTSGKTYIYDAHPLKVGGEWLLALKNGEVVSPNLYVGFKSDKDQTPVYSCTRTPAHPEGDPMLPWIETVSVSNGKKRRTVVEPEWVAEIAIHVKSCKAAFKEEAFRDEVLSLITTQETARRAAVEAKPPSAAAILCATQLLEKAGLLREETGLPVSVVTK